MGVHEWGTHTLSLAGELEPEIAKRWYQSYVEHYWVDGFIKGFCETPRGTDAVTAVDSGPVAFGIGSVASVFGIGAARANGRFDHAVVLTSEVLAASWPTPFWSARPWNDGVLGCGVLVVTREFP